ncbi:MAG: hypothetical protein AB8U44_00080 [Aaplasma endosymbiont of Hyalomma asiaticum]
MHVPLSIPRKMLEIEKLNYKRQCCSMISLITTTVAFSLLALSQGGYMGWLGKGKGDFWLTLDFICAVMACVSLLCGILVVFYIEVEKRKIKKKIESESRKRGFRSRIEEEKANRKLVDRMSDAIENYANRVDLFGSVLNTSLQVSAIVYIFTNGVALSESVKVGRVGMSITHVVDLVSNTAFFISAALFAVSHIIIHRNSKEFSKNLEKQSQMMAMLFTGNLLVWAGKIVCALESIDVIKPAPLKSGGYLPLGWITRLVGIVLCLASLCMIMDSTSKKCEELGRLVEGGEGVREVLTTISTHDVRSCFGYMEYGTR